MNRILLLLLISLVAIITPAQAKRESKIIFNSSYNYEITPIEVGTEGTKYVKVWGYGKRVEDAIISAKRSAVAAAIFKGIPGNGHKVLPTPALCKDDNGYQNHMEYFDKMFYTEHLFLKYINLTSDGAPSGQDRLKVKGGYKVAIKVQIMYTNLQRRLEQDGIIKPLNYGF